MKEAGPALVCPGCRRVEGDRLRVEVLRAEGDWLGCACGRRYPVVDGIPVLLRDLDGWLAQQAPELLRRRDLPAGAALARAAGGVLARNQEQVDCYGSAPPSPWRSWLAARVAALPRPVLEVGAGLGHPDTTALDLNFALLAARGEGVVGDGADPPFLAGSFGAVVLANVLDVCADPWLLFAQAAALLRPGGVLLVGCAYAFRAEIGQARFSEAELRGAMQGRPFGPYASALELVEEVERLRWRLPIGVRSEQVHEVHGLVAVARQSPPSR